MSTDLTDTVSLLQQLEQKTFSFEANFSRLDFK